MRNMATSRVPNEVVADDVTTLRRLYEKQMTGAVTGRVRRCAFGCNTETEKRIG
jgi:hypothetical protein